MGEKGTFIAAMLNIQVFVAPEDVETFEAMCSNLTSELAPRSEYEAQCVTTIIHSYWDIRRTRIVERKMQQRAYEKGIVDPLLDVDWAPQLKGVLNDRRQSERSGQQAMKDLLAHRKRNARTPGNHDPEGC